MHKSINFLKKITAIKKNENKSFSVIKDLNDYHIKEKLSTGTSGSRLKFWGLI